MVVVVIVAMRMGSMSMLTRVGAPVIVGMLTNRRMVVFVMRRPVINDGGVVVMSMVHSLRLATVVVGVVMETLRSKRLTRRQGPSPPRFALSAQLSHLQTPRRLPAHLRGQSWHPIATITSEQSVNWE